MRAIVTLPTYNERDNIERLIKGILQLYKDIHILVIDDNSSDGTGRIVDRLSRELKNIHIIHRPGKAGLSSAYQEGFSWALQKEFDYVVQMDADFSHKPSYIPQLLQSSNSGADLVIGSRYCNGLKAKNWPWPRRFISRFGNLYAQGMLGLKVQDLTSGFRCFRASFLRNIDLSAMRSKGYGFQIEMTYWCARKGGTVKEMPIAFVGRGKGKSKFSLWQILEAFYLVLRLKYFDRKEKVKA